MPDFGRHSSINGAQNTRRKHSPCFPRWHNFCPVVLEMMLQAASDYAIRALRELLAGNGQYVPLRKVCQKANLSENYLYKVLRKLCDRGILQAAPGPHRGFRLAKSPAQITLLEVIEAVQGEIAVYDCILDPSSCSRSAHCRTRAVFLEATEAVRSRLSACTLADVAAQLGSF